MFAHEITHNHQKPFFVCKEGLPTNTPTLQAKGLHMERSGLGILKLQRCKNPDKIYFYTERRSFPIRISSITFLFTLLVSS